MNVAIIEYFNPFTPNKPTGEVATIQLKSDIDIEAQTREIIILPITEDISPKIETSFKTPREYFPQIFSQIEDVLNLFSRGGGSRSQGGTLTDFLDVPLWDKTQPLSLELKFQLFTETDPYLDVIRPAIGLSSLNMLSPFGTTENGTVSGAGLFAVPGISFASIKDAFKVEKGALSAGSGTANLTKESKLISIEIPGILYLNYAFIEVANPVFSSEITASGFPLWCDLNLTIKSIRPANTNMFGYGSNFGANSNFIKSSKQFRRNLEESQELVNQAIGL